MKDGLRWKYAQCWANEKNGHTWKTGGVVKKGKPDGSLCACGECLAKAQGVMEVGKLIEFEKWYGTQVILKTIKHVKKEVWMFHLLYSMEDNDWWQMSSSSKYAGNADWRQSMLRDVFKSRNMEVIA